MQPESGVNLGNPPPGAWYRETAFGGFTIGVSKRGKLMWFLIPFTVLWTGFWMWSMAGGLLMGHRGLEWTDLLALLMIAFSLVLAWACVVIVFGKVEVRREGDNCFVFSGVWSMGKTEELLVAHPGVHDELAPPRTADALPTNFIVLERRRNLQFGFELTDAHRRFLTDGLKQLIKRSNP